MFDRTRTIVAASVVVSLVAFFVRPAQAHIMSIPVANYSFEGSGEQPSVADGGWTTTIAGWTSVGVGAVVVCNPTDSQFAGAAGDGISPPLPTEPRLSGIRERPTLELEVWQASPWTSRLFGRTERRSATEPAGSNMASPTPSLPQSDRLWMPLFSPTSRVSDLSRRPSVARRAVGILIGGSMGIIRRAASRTSLFPTTSTICWTAAAVFSAL